MQVESRNQQELYSSRLKILIKAYPKELIFLPSPQSFKTHLDDTPGRIGVDKEGVGWFEYKLPAHPERFIGRKTQIKDFNDYVNDVIAKKTNIRVYQVLSPSGVGKSSFLLKIHNETKPIGVAVFQDARNFRGAIDLLNLLFQGGEFLGVEE